MHDLLEKFTVQINSKMSSQREEIVEMIRLNRPAPMAIDHVPSFSSVNGMSQVPPTAQVHDSSAMER